MPYFIGLGAGANAANSNIPLSWEYNPEISYDDYRTGPDGSVDYTAYVYDLISSSHLKLKRERKYLGNFISSGRSDGFTFSDRFRCVLEVIEPGIHRYCRINIYKSNGEAWPEAYWFYRYDLIPQIEAVDEERSDIHWSDDINPRTGKIEFSSPVVWTGSSPRTFLDYRKVRGRHLFGESRAPSAFKWFFLSDEMVKALHDAQAVSGIRLEYVGLTNT
jgi:hypothetical protein